MINVGFAFPTLPSSRAVANSVDPSGPPSWTLELVLRGLPRATVLVAPAGNQGSRTRQYPAAFGLTHSNVVGVGSISRRGGQALGVLQLRPVGRVLHRGRERALGVHHELARATEDAQPRG